MSPRVLVLGVGDIASAVAHRLFAAGYGLALHDGPRPATTRRRMAFADAVFEGETELAGIRAVRADDPDEAARLLTQGDAIPVIVTGLAALVAWWRPNVVVDARMRKRAVPERLRGLAPLTIGLGPGFVAGETVDVAIETSWDDLGRVVARGPTRALAGEPRPIGGHARDRYRYAPVPGLFRTARSIGDPVREGEPVAAIGGVVLVAPLAGVLRGLTHDEVPVEAGTKVIEVDPRGGAAIVSGIGERPRRIADGVLAVLRGSSLPRPSNPTRRGMPPAASERDR